MEYTAAVLKEMVRNRYRREARAVLIEELRIGCGFGGGHERSIDVWAIEPNSAKGCVATSYEIKISRGDFKKDLADPLKQRGARLFSDHFFYVAPPGLIRPEEVPDWAGLLEPWVSDDDYCSKLLRQAVPAPLRSKDAPSWPLVVSMLRREAIQFTDAGSP